MNRWPIVSVMTFLGVALALDTWFDERMFRAISSDLSRNPFTRFIFAHSTPVLWKYLQFSWMACVGAVASRPGE
jgi:hypothetical protein